MNRTRLALSVRRKKDRIRSLKISILRQGQCQIEASSPFELEMSPASIHVHNRDFITLMDRVRQEVNNTGSIELSMGFYQQILSELRFTGRSAYTSLADGFYEIWEDHYAAINPEAELDLTIQTESFPLLWEFLYSGPSTGLVDPRLFWGYQHRLTRLLVGVHNYPDGLDIPNKFLFCRHHQLRHWHDEMTALHQLSGHYRLIFNTLDECLTQTEPADDSLVLPVILTCTNGEYHFIHLASHLRSDPETILGSTLILSYLDREVQIPLRRLNAIRGEVWFRQNPLVFLNACKTMTNPEHLSQGESFPRSFLKLGAAAVIATACDIPDLFAMKFAQKFYEFFFAEQSGQSTTASHALQQTRRLFMEEYNNPLGLAYGLYAHNDLTIYWR